VSTKSLRKSITYTISPTPTANTACILGRHDLEYTSRSQYRLLEAGDGDVEIVGRFLDAALFVLAVAGLVLGFAVLSLPLVLAVVQS